ncbi:MAG: PEGA domain-containing protein [Deltaproteobacteria bacterium]|nr:PEGA domain-containing protein [Deltaproteobacteria bacterium]
MAKHITVAGIFFVLSLMLTTRLYAGSTAVFLTFPTNNGDLSPSEVAVINDSITGNFFSVLGDDYAIHNNEAHSECDSACLSEQHPEAWIIQTDISRFGSGFVLKLEAYQKQRIQFTLTSDLCESLEALLAASKTIGLALAKEVKKSTDKNTSLPPAVPTRTVNRGSSSIKVTTTPSDATVYISRYRRHNGEETGISPVEKELVPGRYFITAQKERFLPTKAEVRLDPNETENVHINLKGDYPKNPYDSFGHLFFWSGVAGGAFAIISGFSADFQAGKYNSTGDSISRERSDRWAAAMWISAITGAAFITTGIILWRLSPGDKAYYEKKHGPLACPTVDGHGVSLGYLRRF